MPRSRGAASPSAAPVLLQGADGQSADYAVARLPQIALSFFCSLFQLGPYAPRAQRGQAGQWPVRMSILVCPLGGTVRFTQQAVQQDVVVKLSIGHSCLPGHDLPGQEIGTGRLYNVWLRPVKG